MYANIKLKKKEIVRYDEEAIWTAPARTGIHAKAGAAVVGEFPWAGDVESVTTGGYLQTYRAPPLSFFLFAALDLLFTALVYINYSFAPVRSVLKSDAEPCVVDYWFPLALLVLPVLFCV